MGIKEWITKSKESFSKLSKDKEENIENESVNLENEIQKLKEEIAEIKERNARVELDKRWETSGTRKLCIAILTYIVVVIYSYSISKISNVWLSSIVPVIGFGLSTLSLKAVRKVWEKKIK